MFTVTMNNENTKHNKLHLSNDFMRLIWNSLIVMNALFEIEALN